ncbi:MAG: energy transducer TonB [Leptospiraceae bacterium]|nr:energy transducer TonB [Leptospiraceae bacterium]MCP5502435.1 energy transducer TonB [Leptospiraceae bacterium]
MEEKKPFLRRLKIFLFVKYLFALSLSFSALLHGASYASYYIATHTKKKSDDKIIDSKDIKPMDLDVDITEIPPELINPNPAASNPAPVEKNEWVEGKKQTGTDPSNEDINLNAVSGDGTDKDGYLYSFNGDKVPTPIVDFDLKQYFPEAAKAANITDKTLVVLVQIDEKGNLMTAKIVSGKAGYGFDEAAIKIIKRARFLPGYVKGKPVKMAHRLPITFTLDE